MARTRDGPRRQNGLSEPEERTPEQIERSEKMRALALRRWAKEGASPDAPAGRADGAGSGSNTEPTERDRALALREARRMLRDDKTPAAVKAQLIRTLAGEKDEEAKDSAPVVERLHAAPTDQLAALLR